MTIREFVTSALENSLRKMLEKLDTVFIKKNSGIDASEIKSGVLDIERIPKAALERLVPVADDAARFGLTTDTVQRGDTVKVTSTGKMYYVIDDTNLDSEAGYEPYTAGAASSVPWSGVTGKPDTYTPSGHTHNDNDIEIEPMSDSEIDSIMNSVFGS